MFGKATYEIAELIRTMADIKLESLYAFNIE